MRREPERRAQTSSMELIAIKKAFAVDIRDIVVEDEKDKARNLLKRLESTSKQLRDWLKKVG